MNTDLQMTRPARRAPSRQQGVGLIEVLVAVAILAFGLLGIAALQATALKNGQSSLERSEAVTHAYGILDRMRANIDVARNGGYNIPKTCNLPDAGDQAANDLRAWIDGLHQSLGATSCGKINCVSKPLARQCDITIEWNDSRGTAGSANQTITTSTAL